MGNKLTTLLVLPVDGDFIQATIAFWRFIVEFPVQIADRIIEGRKRFVHVVTGLTRTGWL